MMFYDVSCISESYLSSALQFPFPMHKVAAGLGKKSSGKKGFARGVFVAPFQNMAGPHR